MVSFMSLSLVIDLSHHRAVGHIDGLVQERCNSNALAMELHLSCTNPSILKGVLDIPLIILTLMIALVASVRRDGWCLISSSMALPRLLAVSPRRTINF